MSGVILHFNMFFLSLFSLFQVGKTKQKILSFRRYFFLYPLSIHFSIYFFFLIKIFASFFSFFQIAFHVICPPNYFYLKYMNLSNAYF